MTGVMGAARARSARVSGRFATAERCGQPTVEQMRYDRPGPSVVHATVPVPPARRRAIGPSAAAPLVGLPIVIVLVQQDPAGAWRGLAAWLFTAGNTASGLALAAIALALASWATPRVTAGASGWLRHLPVTEATHRRAALAALVAAQTPIFLALLLLAPLALPRAGSLLAGRLAALLVTMCAAAVAAWPGARSWRSRPLALLAIILATPAQIPGTSAALALVAASERLAGPLARPTRGRNWRLPVPAPLLIGGRALGSRLAIALVPALIPLAAMVALRVNNDLTPAVAAGAARLGVVSRSRSSSAAWSNAWRSGARRGAGPGRCRHAPRTVSATTPCCWQCRASCRWRSPRGST